MCSMAEYMTVKSPLRWVFDGKPGQPLPKLFVEGCHPPQVLVGSGQDAHGDCVVAEPGVVARAQRPGGLLRTHKAHDRAQRRPALRYLGPRLDGSP